MLMALYYSRIKVKFPKNTENIATPIMRIKAQAILSTSLLGAKSPNPTVERVVKAK